MKSFLVKKNSKIRLMRFFRKKLSNWRGICTVYQGSLNTLTVFFLNFWYLRKFLFKTCWETLYSVNFDDPFSLQFVYYHEASQENCLSMLELKRFDLKKNEISVSSFTIPNALLQSNHEMISAIERWKKENTSQSICISEELVMLPFVIL